MLLTNGTLRWFAAATTLIAAVGCSGDNSAGEQGQAGSTGEGRSMSVIEGEVFYLSVQYRV